MSSYARIAVTMLQEDLRLWLPGKDNHEATGGKDGKSEKSEKEKGDREDLDLETAHRLLRQVGDQFCDLLHQEKDALQEHMAEGKVLFSLKTYILHRLKIILTVNTSLMHIKQTYITCICKTDLFKLVIIKIIKHCVLTH